jgi:cytochrome c-type biogenesis protein CcmE
VQFWVRAACLFGVTAPVLVSRQLRLVWWQAFLLALAGALLGHLVWWLVRKRRGPALASAIAVSVGGGVTGWMLRSRPPAPAYYVEVDAVAAHPADHVGERLRLHGYVRPGTLVRGADGRLALVVAVHDHGLPVRYAGAAPDALRDGMEVVAGGRLSADGVFVADELVVKCPSNYDRNAGPRPF